MKSSIGLLAAVAAVLVGAAPVLADWEPGDPYKMHYPQLPDPNGWGVTWFCQGPKTVKLADDWQCTETGPVEDIHFWFSTKNDVGFDLGVINVRIYDDDRSGPFSKPGTLLWETTTLQAGFYPWVHVEDFGDQGWYEPGTGTYVEHDHNDVWQLNLINLDNPFIQEEGNIYWLELGVVSMTQNLGWKTSVDHFEDDAVWAPYDPASPTWQELTDPITGASLDLAFVITPEPTTLMVLALGGLVVMRRRRK